MMCAPHQEPEEVDHPLPPAAQQEGEVGGEEGGDSPEEVEAVGEEDGGSAAEARGSGRGLTSRWSGPTPCTPACSPSRRWCGAPSAYSPPHTPSHSRASNWRYGKEDLMMFHCTYILYIYIVHI